MFMSATITNDAFLVKGLNLRPETIRTPLTYDAERWYGEKMVLIPSLIDGSLTREAIISQYGPPSPRRGSGVVALVPGSRQASDWAAQGALVVNKSSISDGVKSLREKNYEKTLVITNYYDGIDLPDSTCRLLIIDSKPFSNGLVDSYSDSCRSSSEVTSLKLARTIEQGMGRAVRGQRDYCAIVLTGANLVRAVRSGSSKQQFSGQTQRQVSIGLEVSQMAKDDVGEGADPLSVLKGLIGQSRGRNEDWKAFYAQEMEAVSVKPSEPRLLDIFSMELKAEEKYRDGEYEAAAKIMQDLIDKHVPADNKEDRGWYLQEIARLTLPASSTKSNALQVKAHKVNKALLRPKSGFVFEKLLVGQKRLSLIKEWLQSFESNEAMLLTGEDICSNLAFGVPSNDFEEALKDFGKALGFGSQRPDKEMKQGPDNLWALREGEYLLIESKNEVADDRVEIYKTETGQMNNSCAWFKTNYPGAKVKNLLIIPTKLLGLGAGFNEPVQIVRKKNLKRLVNNFRQFLVGFKQIDLTDIDDSSLESALVEHELTREDISSKYSEDPTTSPAKSR